MMEKPSDKIWSQSQQKLDFDLDGDGLTTREELSMGLNPNAPDTDGDKVSDGDEIAHGSNPARPDDRNLDALIQQLRQRYLDYACNLLGWNRFGLTYQSLVDDVAGSAWIGKALDAAVYESAIAQGEKPAEAAYLLTQSPYLQFLARSGRVTEEEVVNYVGDHLADYEERQTQSQLTFNPIEEDWEHERRA
jgi:hypothetical protein